jgi:hypothetical protein
MVKSGHYKSGYTDEDDGVLSDVCILTLQAYVCVNAGF